jgi:opacity protein-like surface antigen
MQVGYDVLSQSNALSGTQLTPYYRWERVDTQATMPVGFDRSRSTDNTFNTIGVEVKPIPNIVVKADYAWVSNDAETSVNQFSIGLGYVF